MKRTLRSTLEPFSVSREHVFQDDDGDKYLERVVEERARKGVPLAPLWAKWLSMNDNSREHLTKAPISNVSLTYEDRGFSREGSLLPRKRKIVHSSASPSVESQPSASGRTSPPPVPDFFQNRSNAVVKLRASPKPNLPLQRSSLPLKASSSIPSASSASSFNLPASPIRLIEQKRSLEAVSPQAVKRSAKGDLIQADWDIAVKSAKAATIKIVNEVDDEMISLPKGFRYIEHGYWGEDNKDTGEFVSGCDCEDGLCKYPNDCCVGLMQMTQNIFPYTTKGLFAFNLRRGVEIIECNKKCSCDKSCRNRVAQKPRTIPLEVFKTPRYGWGVRATVRIKRGRVIGIYSGVLISRKLANTLTGVRRSYVFDLDHLEGSSDDDELKADEKFSVDSYSRGNWGRFINHSCDPNMTVWPILYDKAEANKCYLAFIAIKDIPVRTELTLDYHPHISNDYVSPPLTSKGKGKAKEDGCFCESEKCRGWRP